MSSQTPPAESPEIAGLRKQLRDEKYAKAMEKQHGPFWRQKVEKQPDTEAEDQRAREAVRRSL